MTLANLLCTIKKRIGIIIRNLFMSRTCELTAVKLQYGHNVSHSNRRTNRVFLPNLHEKRLFSEALGVFAKFRITPKALKTIDSKGGFDNYLLSTSDKLLSTRALRVKKALLKRQTSAQQS